MRTANEFYDFCITNNYGEGVNKKSSLKHFQLIEEALQPDENVQMCFLGSHNYYSVFLYESDYAYVVTDKRLIMGNSSWIEKKIQSVPLENVTSVALDTGLLTGTLKIGSRNGMFRINLGKIASQNVYEHLQKILSLRASPIKTDNESEKQNSDVDEILKYKQLFDVGAITQEEFEAKKKKILGI